MVVIEDILDELYTLDNSQWYDNVSRILTLLNYPVRMEYNCQWEEFLYIRSEKLRAISSADRKILSKCRTIASFAMERSLKRIKLFAFDIIDENQSSRNNTVYEITKLFRDLFGRFVILVFVNGDELAFSGILSKYKKTEVIISEWFGYNKDYELNNKILEVDFSLFLGYTLNEIYNDYLWSIARHYVKYKESKQFLIFGCNNPETYEEFVHNPDGGGMILAKIIDCEETLQINSDYYPDIYGNDYFMDDSDIEIDLIEKLEVENDIEFEWTMLEMELAAESEEADEKFEDEENEEFYDDYYEKLNGMNPEEMLKFIRGE